MQAQEMTYQRLMTTSQDIYIFGAGDVGAYILKKCLQQGIKIKGVFDNDKEKHAQEMAAGIPIISPLLAAEQGKIIVLAAVWDAKWLFDCMADCRDITWYLACDLYSPAEIATEEFICRKKLERVWYYHYFYGRCNEENLNTLDLVLTEKCSLKCRDCSNLMQFYTAPQDYDIAFIKAEIDRLMEVFAHIYELRLLGGEPFMYRDIAQVIDYANNINGIKRICIFTNGTIVPRHEALSAMADGGKTWLSISDYGNLSYNLQAMTARLDEYGINYEVKPIAYWTKCSSFTAHHRSTQEAAKVFRECCVKNVVTALAGKLYPCPFIAHGMNLQAIPLCENDRVDFMQENVVAVRRIIREKLKNRAYFASCDFCNGRPYINLSTQEKIEPYIQTDKPLPYERQS